MQNRLLATDLQEVIGPGGLCDSLVAKQKSGTDGGGTLGRLLALGLRECGYGASRTGIGGSGHNRWPKRYLADDVICE